MSLDVIRSHSIVSFLCSFFLSSGICVYHRYLGYLDSGPWPPKQRHGDFKNVNSYDIFTSYFALKQQLWLAMASVCP